MLPTPFRGGDTKRRQEQAITRQKPPLAVIITVGPIHPHSVVLCALIKTCDETSPLQRSGHLNFLLLLLVEVDGNRFHLDWHNRVLRICFYLGDGGDNIHARYDSPKHGVSTLPATEPVEEGVMSNVEEELRAT